VVLHDLSGALRLVRRAPLFVLVCQRNVHDTEQAFLLDFSPVIFIDLDDLLDSGANRNKEPSRLGQLVD